MVGGIVALVFGAASLGSMGVSTLTNPSLFRLTGPLMTLVVGAVALLTSSRISEEPFAVVAAVLGFIVGGEGGVLIGVAGISAILSKHALSNK
jgi:hypothetical protein